MQGKRKYVPGPMMLIMLCFFASASIRIGTQGMAIASETPVSDEIILDTQMACAPLEDQGSLLAFIKERQMQLLQRETEITERREILDIVEKRIATQLAILKAAEAKLASTLAIADSAAENDVARLTEVYEKMKPKNAAQIFETMEMSFAAGFLSRMKPESAAGILSEMPAELAYSVSVIMAGRNARAPTE